MKLEMCGEFYYKTIEKNEDVFSKFNTSKENLFRNNKNIKIYSGEWLRIKVNDYKIHFVKPAETLKLIAEVYKTNIEKIIDDNCLKTDKLFIGQKLKIYK